jgi:hypothetical protein
MAGLEKFGGAELKPFLIVLRNNGTRRSLDRPCRVVGRRHACRARAATIALDDPVPTVTGANAWRWSRRPSIRSSHADNPPESGRTGATATNRFRVSTAITRRRPAAATVDEAPNPRRAGRRRAVRGHDGTSGQRAIHRRAAADHHHGQGRRLRGRRAVRAPAAVRRRAPGGQRTAADHRHGRRDRADDASVSPSPASRSCCRRAT